MRERYEVDRLHELTATAFERGLRSLVESSEPPAGDSVTSKQRNRPGAFVWGHDHDFGSFGFQGAMGRRHIRHVAEFVDRFRVLPADLSGRRILDIGCWTGGTSL